MSTIKDLFENEELMNNIVEDLENIPEDTAVCYAVWALGFNKSAELTDDEILLEEFNNPDEAVTFAENVTIEQINKLGGTKPISTDVVYFSIEVETVVVDPEDEEGGTMNIGTVFTKDLWLDAE